jgi:ESS family glutamate:Na+ symporter
MEHWAGGFLQDMLIITSLIAVAAGMRRAWPAMHRLAMPDALIAGILGVLLGPAVFDLLPFSAENLEFVIYHSLALVFITVSLQSPPPAVALAISWRVAAALRIGKTPWKLWP